MLSPAEGYDIWANSYADENNPVKRLNYDALTKMIPHPMGKDVLDLGCGPGYFCRLTEEMGARSVIGLDQSMAMLKEARENCQSQRVGLLLSPVDNVPFEDAIFDIIICSLVAGHLKKIDRLISEISRLLKNEGVCLLSDFHPYNTRHGAERTFQNNKKTYAIQHYLHEVDDYLNCFRTFGLSVQDVVEPMWCGNPLVFVIQAVKSS